MRNRVFFVLSLLLSLSLAACATKKDSSGIIALKIASSIPDGAIHANEKIFRSQPPETAFNHAVFWYQIAALHQESAVNKKGGGIVLKSCRIYCRDNNGNMIYERNFKGNATLGPELGGLYNRNPKWFANDSHTPIVEQEVFPDGLAISASSTPDKIVHWWSDRFPYDARYKYQVEMRVKIIGDVALQMGGDYWKGQSSLHNGWDAECRGKNNCEAFVSDWYGDTKGEFITITREL